MKKLLSLILAMALLCASIPAFAEETPAHVLVVYFSQRIFYYLILFGLLFY